MAFEFPVELLEAVLRFLPKLSLKTARLTCKKWGEVGARCLFRRIYFAPRKELLDVFIAITQNAAFASNVEVLVYDARLFWPYVAEPEVYSKAHSLDFPEGFLGLDEHGNDDEGNLGDTGSDSDIIGNNNQG